jgi:hypothetical protein
MEIATSIKFKNKMAVALTSTGGSKSEIPAGELGARGLPGNSPHQTSCTLDFRDFRNESFAEYIHAFNQPIVKNINHSTWSVVHSGTRYVIPALALIRAFVRPNSILIPILFKPQSLDDICMYSGHTADCFVRPVGDLGGRRIHLSQAVSRPLSWFYCFPSARRSWASVYQSAKEGALHLELPEATATMQLRGVQAGATNYVTQIKVLSIEAHEQPFDFAAGHPSYIWKHRGRKRFNAKIPVENNYKKLSQAEWDGLVSILASYRRTTRPDIDIRSLLDCILQRLSTNVSWKTAADMNGVTLDSATKAMERWQADGRIDRMRARLREMRDTEEANSKASRHGDTKEPLHIDYQELSQTEWDAVAPLIGDCCLRGTPSLDNRSLVNCVWQWLSFDVSLQTAADMNGVPLMRVKSALRRWQADGRHDRVIACLRDINNSYKAHSNEFIHLDSRRPLDIDASKLSQAEWNAVAPLLSANSSNVNLGRDNRSLLNCILQKLSSKVSWQTAADVNDMPLQRVKYTLRRWRADERLDRVIKRLRELRDAGEA